MELAPSMGLCKRIVDLVETGSTLKANGLVVVENICDVSTRLAVNRSYMKTNLNIYRNLLFILSGFLIISCSLSV